MSAVLAVKGTEPSNGTKSTLRTLVPQSQTPTHSQGDFRWGRGPADKVQGVPARQSRPTPGPDTGRAPTPPCANSLPRASTALGSPQGQGVLCHCRLSSPARRAAHPRPTVRPGGRTGQAHGGAGLGCPPTRGTAGRQGGRRATQGLGSSQKPGPRCSGAGPAPPSHQRRGRAAPELSTRPPAAARAPGPRRQPGGTGRTGRAGTHVQRRPPHLLRPRWCPHVPSPSRPSRCPDRPGSQLKMGLQGGDSPDLPQPRHLTGHTEDKPGRTQAKDSPRHTSQPRVPGLGEGQAPRQRAWAGWDCVPCPAPRPRPPVPPGTSAPLRLARGTWATAARPPHPELRERPLRVPSFRGNCWINTLPRRRQALAGRQAAPSCSAAAKRAPAGPGSTAS